MAFGSRMSAPRTRTNITKTETRLRRKPVSRILRGGLQITSADFGSVGSPVASEQAVLFSQRSAAPTLRRHPAPTCASG